MKIFKINILTDAYEETNECFIDGYDIGERDLEGVPIRIYNDGSDVLKAEFVNNEGYLSKFSENYLESCLKDAINDADECWDNPDLSDTPYRCYLYENEDALIAYNESLKP